MTMLSQDTGTDLAACAFVPLNELAKLLQLPEGAYIDAAEAAMDEDRTLRIRIRGAGWLTKPGARLTWASALVTEYRDEDGHCFKRVIDWDMPQGSL